MQGADPRHRRDGRRADPDALALDLPALSEHVGRHLGCNGDHVAAIEFDPRRVRDVLGLPGYADFHKGKPITTMTYDFWVGRRGQPLRRHPLHAAGDLPHHADEPALRRRPRAGGRAVVVGAPEEAGDRATGPAGSSCWRWSRTPTTGRSTCRRPPAAARCAPTRARSRSARSPTRRATQSIRVREAADAAMRRIAHRRGLGRFMKLTETRGVYGGAPARRLPDGRPRRTWAPSPTTARSSATRACTASARRSSRPPSGVNPSLTIAAVAERCAERLVGRAADFGLPARPRGSRRPRRRRSSASASSRRRTARRRDAQACQAAPAPASPGCPPRLKRRERGMMGAWRDSGCSPAAATAPVSTPSSARSSAGRPGRPRRVRLHLRLGRRAGRRGPGARRREHRGDPAARRDDPGDLAHQPVQGRAARASTPCAPGMRRAGRRRAGADRRRGHARRRPAAGRRRRPGRRAFPRRSTTTSRAPTSPSASTRRCRSPPTRSTGCTRRPSRTTA